MNHELRLIGKKALVTGAGTGIRHETALEFARQGADVVLHYAVDPGALTAAEEIRSMGRCAMAYQANFDRVDEVDFPLWRQIYLATWRRKATAPSN